MAQLGFLYGKGAGFAYVVWSNWSADSNYLSMSCVSSKSLRTPLTTATTYNSAYVNATEDTNTMYKVVGINRTASN